MASPYRDSTPLRLVVFDYDGTLVDSHAMLHKAYEAAFRAVGLPIPSQEATRAAVGFPMLETLARMAPPETDRATLEAADRALHDARRFQRSGHEPMDRLFDGVLDVLQTLYDSDSTLIAVATNKSRRGLEHSLASHRIARYFVKTCTADESPSKPHPAMLEELMGFAGVAPEQTAMVGDTIVDMQLARNARVSAIGVSWGYHQRVALEAEEPAALIDHMSELPDVLARLWG